MPTAQGFSEVDITQPTKAHRAECHHHSWRNCGVLESLTLIGSNSWYKPRIAKQTQTPIRPMTIRNQWSMVYRNVCEMQKQWKVEVVRCTKEWAMDEDANGKLWNEWTDTIMAEWNNEYANSWVSESVSEWVRKWKNRWMNEWMKTWRGMKRNEGRNEGRHECVKEERKEGRQEGRKERRQEGRKEGRQGGRKENRKAWMSESMKRGRNE